MISFKMTGANGLINNKKLLFQSKAINTGKKFSSKLKLFWVKNGRLHFLQDCRRKNPGSESL